MTLALAAPPSCLAEESQGPTDDGKSILGILDRPHDYLSEKFVNLSNKVDSFFADDRVFQESRSSYLRFFSDLVFEKNGTSNFNPQLQAKVVLPALERRLHLLIETNTDETIPVPTSEIETQKKTPAVNAPNDFLTSIQLLLKDTLHWNINTDSGIRIHGFSLDPFARSRISHVQIVNNWQFRLTESLYWFAQSGAGETTQFDADYKVSANYLARSRTLAVWSDHDQRYYYQQSWFLFHPMDVNHALSYQANIFGESQPNTHVTEYDVSAAWRIRVHREWLFFDVQPGLAWPETVGFRFTPTVLLRVEAIFGDVGCGCYGI